MEIKENSLPRITIVTPNLNGGSTLRQTIESVVRQDYPNLEYIIVDGGSTDDSEQIIAEYRANITAVLQGRDRTMYDGIAKGFDQSTGEILAWLNSDDLYEPGVLRRAGRYFAEHPDRFVIYFDDTVWKQGWRVPNRLQKYVGLPELLRGHILYQDSVFFRRSAYEKVGGLDRETVRLAGDYQLWLRLAAQYRLYYIPEHGSCFRIRPNQLSGDWPSYVNEMAQVRAGAERYLPRLFWLKSAYGMARRRLASRTRAQQRLIYELRDESENWSPVEEAPARPFNSCLCPICRQSPRRLLFSTPDTRFGDRTVRRVYFCARCRTAFLFPQPNSDEMADLYQRTYSADLPPIGDPKPGTYSPYRVPSLLDRGWHYRWLGYVFHLVARASRVTPIPVFPYDDIVPIYENKDAALLEIGCFEGRVLDLLRGLGYQNLFGTDFNTKACEAASAKGHQVFGGDIAQTNWPGKPMDAIILNQLIEHIADPVDFLEGLKQRLVAGGRIYLSTPNLDSAWLDHYGPAWAHWHFPFHVFITGAYGLREIAQRAGYDVRWIKTSSPIHWSYMSDALGVRGLGGYVSHNIYNPDRRLWLRAAGTTVYSWLLYDWRARGDCLYACLVKKEK